MSDPLFWTEQGVPVPAVTTDQMREVDRIAVEDSGLGILQMMENAGRNLAANVISMLGKARGEVTVLVGAGGTTAAAGSVAQGTCTTVALRST
jgi:NAD(P)H-hydrate epimerase